MLGVTVRLALGFIAALPAWMRKKMLAGFGLGIIPNMISLILGLRRKVFFCMVNK